MTKKIIRKRKTREVMTKKRALEQLTRVLDIVESGDMGVRRACEKVGFPLHKYSYWKKVKEETDALEAMNNEGGEVLVDTSTAGIKARLRESMGLKQTVDGLQKSNDRKAEVMDRMAEKIVNLEAENRKLKDALLKRLIDL